jgi:hypothetical protein
MSKTEKISKKIVEPLGFPLTTKIKSLAAIVSLIDGYRINKTLDFRKLDSQIKRGLLGRPFAEKWKNIRKVLWRIGTFPKNIPYVNKMTTVRILSQIAGVITLVVASALMIAQIWLQLDPILVSIGLFVYVLGTALIGLSALMRRRVAIRIAEYYYEDHERWKKEQAYLKGVVQQLIDALARQLRRQKLAGTEKDLQKIEKDMSTKKYKKVMEKYKIKLYNIDYTGIQILKKPGRISKNYLVIPKL